jgi:ketosteroid isomerase-like protein
MVFINGELMKRHDWVVWRATCLILLFAAPISACSLWPFAKTEVIDGQRLSREAQALLDTDRAFAARSLVVGAPQAFYEYLDAQGLLLPPRGEPAYGPDGVRMALAEDAAIRLSWEPRYAEVFESANWGWTWGEWQAHEPGAGGRRVGQGRYVNLWKKQPDGRWKVRVDIGNVELKPQSGVGSTP